jgi:hypothetical protein
VFDIDEKKKKTEPKSSLGVLKWYGWYEMIFFGCDTVCHFNSNEIRKEMIAL